MAQVPVLQVFVAAGFCSPVIFSGYLCIITLKNAPKLLAIFLIGREVSSGPSNIPINHSQAQLRIYYRPGTVPNRKFGYSHSLLKARRIETYGCCQIMPAGLQDKE